MQMAVLLYQLKTTHTGKYLGFSSHYMLQQEVSVFRTHLPSSPIQQKAKEVVFMKALRQNCYPKQLHMRVQDASYTQSKEINISLP